MTTTASTPTLADIDAKAKNYRAARDLLGSRVQQLEDQMAAARRNADPLIRAALTSAKAAENELQELLVASAALFRRPRTHVFHGVRVGWGLGKPAIEIPDQDNTLRLIRKHLSEEQIELLIATKEKLRKQALADLPGSDLKRIGVRVEPAKDGTVIKPVDSELDKLLDQLLKTEKRTSDEESE
ncbi:hypothetical protein [Hydrocarboniphaga effusa]|uniref:hypothetical protein n=1 Tax=Hydrocarboniphaga effusa TaxID=243629 RepID=UPI003BA8DE51